MTKVMTEILEELKDRRAKLVEIPDNKSIIYGLFLEDTLVTTFEEHLERLFVKAIPDIYTLSDVDTAIAPHSMHFNLDDADKLTVSFYFEGSCDEYLSLIKETLKTINLYGYKKD